MRRRVLPTRPSRSKGGRTSLLKPSSSPPSKPNVFDAGDLKIAARRHVSTSTLGDGACPFRGRIYGIFPLDERCPTSTLVQPVPSGGAKRVLDDTGAELFSTGCPDALVPVVEQESYCDECVNQRVREREAR